MGRLKDLEKMATDPRFIPGIYNYCDRWCERCAFTSRCLLYAQEESGAADGVSAEDTRSEAFWKKLHDIFMETREMLAQAADEQGIDFNSADANEIAAGLDRHRRSARTNALAEAAMAYAAQAQSWLQKAGPALERKEDELSGHMRMGVNEDAAIVEAMAILDALEVIQRYQYQVYIKLTRALDRDNWDEDPQKVIQTDCNGSVKVALLALERSMAAWMELRNHLPDTRREILDLLARLDRLMRHAEESFPNARKFVRPGFDTGEAPLWYP
jgi:hypothetical protein